MKKFLKWLTLGVGICFGAWTLWNWSATTELERAVAALRKQGLPTTVAELENGVPPFDVPPTDAQNAAHLLEAAFALAKSIEPPPDLDWDLGELPVPESVRRNLSLYDEVFDLLYRAADRPRCRFDLEWRDKFAMMLPHLMELSPQ